MAIILCKSAVSLGPQMQVRKDLNAQKKKNKFFYKGPQYRKVAQNDTIWLHFFWVFYLKYFTEYEIIIS